MCSPLGYALRDLFDFLLTMFSSCSFRNTSSCLQEWMDYQLRWDEADYGGISVLRLPPDKVSSHSSSLHFLQSWFLYLLKQDTQFVILDQNRDTIHVFPFNISGLETRYRPFQQVSFQVMIVVKNASSRQSMMTVIEVNINLSDDGK